MCDKPVLTCWQSDCILAPILTVKISVESNDKPAYDISVDICREWWQSRVRL